MDNEHMKETLLPILRCPGCRESLLLTTQSRRQDEVWVGRLDCSSCGRQYPIENGLPLLFLDDDIWSVKAKEAAGWVSLHKSLGIYETGPESIDHQIPYTDEEPWPKVAHNFDAALDQLELTGSEQILDLGAGRGWAAKKFATLGCQVIALDVVPDERIGLGRATALMERVGTYFERVIADGENLPFIDGSFDLVFCSAALHHSSHLRLLSQNIGRVLRQGGRLIAINEPAIGLLDDEQVILDRDTGEEQAHHINETRPNLLEYARAFSAGDLTLTGVSSPTLEALPSAARRDQAVNLGAVLPGVDVQDLRTSYYQLSEYVRKRLQARRLPDYPAGLNLLPTNSQEFVSEILLWGGGDVILSAVKV